MRLALAFAVALTLLLPPTTVSVTAAPGDRTLYLYHTHTKETGRFTYKRGGQFDQAVLRQLNSFLADWRTKEPTKMDPALFDLLWVVYQDVGAREPINIVSSYRSPKTNAMLAKRSSSVADNSQHMKGKAIDFYIPGVNLSRLRESVMRHQVGGIGYYPTSGSPFVHADTGSVRAWPRMTRAQLKKVFPDGRTLHIPTDGKPLSAEGRRYAEAEWKKCRMVPCAGAVAIDSGSATTMLASLDGEAPVPAVRTRTLMDVFFGEPEEPAANVAVAAIGSEPSQRVVQTYEVVPMPATRSWMAATANEAPIPARKSERLVLATLDPGENALSALDAFGSAPRGRVHMTNAPVTAYVDPAQDPEAEQALRMIISREMTASLPKSMTLPTNAPAPATAVASLPAKPTLKGMFDLTFNALTTSRAPEPVAIALADLAESRQPNPSIEARGTELIAPDLDHIPDSLIHPVAISNIHYAALSEAEGYIDKGTELGPLTGRVGFEPDTKLELNYDRFIAIR
jgi:uncharacterized protein YcbK (DUF882 family)